jgi:hypothetical protein
MPQQNSRLNTDMDSILTTAYHDGDKWVIYVAEEDGDNKTLGTTTDAPTSNTVIGLLKSLKNLFPSTLSNGSIRAQIMSALPTGTNTIGKVDVTNFPTLQKVEIQNPVALQDVEVSNFPALQQVEVTNQESTIEKTVKTGSVYGVLSVSDTPIKLSVGATELVGRHRIDIFNSSANDVFVGFDDTVTIANGYPLKSGQEKSFHFNPATVLSIYSVASVASEIRLLEIK